MAGITCTHLHHPGDTTKNTQSEVRNEYQRTISMKWQTHKSRGVEIIAENIIECLPVVDEATKAICKEKMIWNLLSHFSTLDKMCSSPHTCPQVIGYWRDCEKAGVAPLSHAKVSPLGPPSAARPAGPIGRVL
jgi:hypothetical protein